MTGAAMDDSPRGDIRRDTDQADTQLRDPVDRYRTTQPDGGLNVTTEALKVERADVESLHAVGSLETEIMQALEQGENVNVVEAMTSGASARVRDRLGGRMEAADLAALADKAEELTAPRARGAAARLQQKQDEVREEHDSAPGGQGISLTSDGGLLRGRPLTQAEEVAEELPAGQRIAIRTDGTLVAEGDGTETEHDPQRQRISQPIDLNPDEALAMGLTIAQNFNETEEETAARLREEREAREKAEREELAKKEERLQAELREEMVAENLEELIEVRDDRHEEAVAAVYQDRDRHQHLDLENDVEARNRRAQQIYNMFQDEDWRERHYVAA